MSIADLFLRAGEPVTASHVTNLAREIGALPKVGGRGVRRTVYPWGTVHNFQGAPGGGSPPIFAPSVSATGTGYEVRWSKGTIGGTEPTIEGIAISGADDDGAQPALVVKEADFADGQALVYFRLAINPDWSIAKIEPVALPQAPLDDAWTAHKLALVLSDDGAVWRAVYSNQGWLAVNRRASGRALHLFWGKF